MLRQALAADEAQTLFTLSAFFIGFGVGQLLLGPLSDRFGRKRPLLAGLVLYIIASVGCALATTMSAIVFWRFPQAFGGSMVPMIVQAMVRDLYDRNQECAHPVAQHAGDGRGADRGAADRRSGAAVARLARDLLGAGRRSACSRCSARLRCPKRSTPSRRNETQSAGHAARLSRAVSQPALRRLRQPAPPSIFAACLPSSPARRLSTSNISACRRNITAFCSASTSSA